MKKMLQRLTAVFLSLVLLVSVTPITAVASGLQTMSDDQTWQVSGGVLTISGTGNMDDWTADSRPPWESYRDEITSVVINEGITRVGDYAFYGYTALTEVSFPSTLLYIGYYSFYGCSSLLAAEIPASVQQVFGCAFRNCTSLQTVTWTQSENQILHEEAFKGCSSLVSAEVPQNAVMIRYGAFSDCTSLKTFDFPDTITDVQPQIFWGCSSLESITLPEQATIFGDVLFGDCTSLKSIVIPDTVTKIGNSCFNGCSSLETITYNGTLTQIPDYAFWGCEKLAEFVIPDGVTTIGTAAFGNCFSLTEIVLPESCVSLASMCFSNCPELTRMTVPASVTSIGDAAFALNDKMVMLTPEGSYAYNYAVANDIMVNETGVRLTVDVQNTDGISIMNGCAINWYEEGSDTILATGETLINVDSTKNYDYEVILAESHGYNYLEPGRQTVSGDAGSFVCTVESIPIITVTGKVVDKEGNGVWAKLTFEQLFNGKYTMNQQAWVSETDGSYSNQYISTVPTEVVITADGYFTRKVDLSELAQVTESTWDLGTILLTEVPVNRWGMEFTVSAVAAVGPDETAESVPYLNEDQVEFDIFRLDEGWYVDNFVVQTPYIYFQEWSVPKADNVAEGVEPQIQVVARTKDGTMCSEPVVVTMDENGYGTEVADLVLLENGCCRVESFDSDSEKRVMIFNSDGGFLRADTTRYDYKSVPLEAGTYTFVFLEKTDLIGSVPYMGRLEEMGLVEGTDYIRHDVTIENGVVSILSELSVPELDESKFYYTNAENTYLHTGATSVAVGRFVTMRIAYEIDPKYAAEMHQICVELPGGVSVMDGSVTLDGEYPVYTATDWDMTVSTGQTSGVLRFVIQTLEAGDWNMEATLRFSVDGSYIVQPLGTAALEITNAKLKVPEKTCQKSVTVSGTSLAWSEVTVYDNGSVVGSTTANGNGNWTLNYELEKPHRYSIHQVYAELRHDSYPDGVVVTDTEEMIYHDDYIDVESVTMINTAHLVGQATAVENVTTISSVVGMAAPSYAYWPAYPTFTYQVKFTNGDDTNLTNVYVVTTDFYGNDTYVGCTYDRVTGTWIGTADYLEYTEAPRYVGVSYDLVAMEDTGVLDEAGMEELMDGTVNQLETLSDEFDTMMETGELVDTENGVTMDLIFEDEAFGYMTMELLDYADFSMDEWEETGALAVTDEETGETIYLSNAAVGSEYAYYYACPDTQEYMKISITMHDPEAAALFMDEDTAATLDFIASLIPSPYGIGQFIKSLMHMGNDLYNANMLINDYKGYLRDQLNTIMKILETKCMDGTYKVNPALQGDFLGRCYGLAGAIDQFEVNAWNRYAAYLATEGLKDYVFGKVGDKLGKKISDNIDIRDEYRKLYRMWQKQVQGKSGLGRLSNAAKAGLAEGTELTEEALANLFGKSGTEMMKALGLGIDLPAAIGQEYWKVADQLNQLMQEVADAAAGKKCPVKPKPDPVNPYADPSGYVYEAVPSNRLEGVEAKLYYLDEETGNPVFWDAPMFEQVNPQITDANGSYGWDVFDGQWLVTYTKDGYQDADSREDPATNENGWLPVPPIQTQVNTAMISLAAPEVESVNVYDQEVQILFSQYMKPETVNEETVTVTCGGIPVSGTLHSVNLEYDYNKTYQYASIYVFQPEETLRGSVQVSVEGCVNYAGTAMETVYKQRMIAQVKPTALSAPETINVAYNSGALLELQLQPAEAAAGQTVTIVSASPSIVGVVNRSVTLDENGKATVMLEGKLPGSGQISVSLDGTDLQTLVSVKVADVVSQTQVSKVQASIPTGSQVTAGTTVTLTTDTEGAKIYYTLDGSCPCVIDNPARQAYTGPVTINADTLLIAYAVLDGMADSPTAGFVYKVERTADVELFLKNGNIVMQAFQQEPGTHLITAVYSDSDQLLDCVVTVVNNSGSAYDSLELSADAALVQTFILDENWTPIRKPVEESVP